MVSRCSQATRPAHLLGRGARAARSRACPRTASPRAACSVSSSSTGPNVANYARAMDADREWWLRVPGVLLVPAPVFVALRDESREDVDARSEPVLALTSLAGIAAALGSSTARTLYDDPEYDALLVAVWAVVAGGFLAFAGYFIVGGALYLGARGLGSQGTFRRARHVLAFALAPVALSLFVVWPLQLAAFGTRRLPPRRLRRGRRGDAARRARGRLRGLVGGAARRRRPRRPRLDLVALARRRSGSSRSS